MTVGGFTLDDAHTVAAWRYPPPYGVYDVSEDPSWQAEIFDPERWGISYFAADDDQTHDLAGFLELVASERGSGDWVGSEVEVGLGLRPDLTGRGIGVDFVEAALAFSRERWGPRTFALDVLPWNERAIRCYEKAGFDRGEVYVRAFPGGNEVTFLRMARPA